MRPPVCRQYRRGEAPGLDALDVGGEFETQQAVELMELSAACSKIVASFRSLDDGAGPCGPFASAQKIGGGDEAVTLCAEPAHEIAGLVHVPEQGTDIGNMFHGITFPGGMRGPAMGRVRRSLLRSDVFVSGVRVTGGTGLLGAASSRGPCRAIRAATGAQTRSEESDFEG